jgi:hypothetical protein
MLGNAAAEAISPSATLNLVIRLISIMLIIKDDSKLLSGFPWPKIFKPEKQNKAADGI